MSRSDPSPAAHEISCLAWVMRSWSRVWKICIIWLKQLVKTIEFQYFTWMKKTLAIWGCKTPFENIAGGYCGNMIYPTDRNLHDIKLIKVKRHMPWSHATSFFWGCFMLFQHLPQIYVCQTRSLSAPQKKNIHIKKKKTKPTGPSLSITPPPCSAFDGGISFFRNLGGGNGPQGRTEWVPTLTRKRCEMSSGALPVDSNSVTEITSGSVPKTNSAAVVFMAMC